MLWVKNNLAEKGVGREGRLFLTQHAAAFGSVIGLQSVCITAAGEMWLHPPALTPKHTSWLDPAVLVPWSCSPAPAVFPSPSLACVPWQKEQTVPVTAVPCRESGDPSASLMGKQNTPPPPSLLVLHTDGQLLQNLPRMPGAGVELLTLLILSVLSAFLVCGSLAATACGFPVCKPFILMRKLRGLMHLAYPRRDGMNTRRKVCW